MVDSWITVSSTSTRTGSRQKKTTPTPLLMDTANTTPRCQQPPFQDASTSKPDPNQTFRTPSPRSDPSPSVSMPDISPSNSTAKVYTTNKPAATPDWIMEFSLSDTELMRILRKISGKSRTAGEKCGA